MTESISPKDILKSARDEGVRFVRLQFADLMGWVKNVEIPVSQLEKALYQGITFDGSAIEGFVRLEESDMVLVPDPSTWLIFPFGPAQGRVARLVCDIHTMAGSRFSGDSRVILKRVLREAEALGFTTMNVGLEPEFFLLRLDSNDEPTIETNDQGGYFDLAPLDLGENCRRDIVLTLEQMGFRVEASHHEVAPGQHEIDFQYADAIHAADNIMTFKLVVKTIARRHGLFATFMPKPIYGIAGSGMHCHQSLYQGNANAFSNPSDPLGLSVTARHYMAGLLLHAPALTAIANPTVNSYKRLVPGEEAPMYIAWSDHNRSPLIRVPIARGNNTRIELRSPDPAANPYLLISAMLKAGLDGIQRKLPAPQPVHRNLFEMSDEERLSHGIAGLPRTLGEALEALADDAVIQDAIGHHAYEHFAFAKSIEWDMFQRHVHPWERDQYIMM